MNNKIDKSTLFLLIYSALAVLISIFLPKWPRYQSMLFYGLIFSSVIIGLQMYLMGVKSRAQAKGFGFAFIAVYLVTLAPVVIGFLIPAVSVWRLTKQFPKLFISLLTIIFILYLFLMVVLYPERLFDWLYFLQHDL